MVLAESCDTHLREQLDPNAVERIDDDVAHNGRIDNDWLLYYLLR